LVYCGLPVEKVTDWTEEEADIISATFCPQTRQEYELIQRQEEHIREVIRQFRLESSQREQNQSAFPTEPQEDDMTAHAEVEDIQREEYHKQEDEKDEEFPLEFAAEDMCPVCQEENYQQPNCLLKLPCGHSLCKTCLKPLTTCPVCRHHIDRSLVKRKIVG
jgi:hypothetical protein